MACDISAGRLEPCKDSMGGIKAVYFVNYGDMPESGVVVSASDDIETVGTAIPAYKY